MTVQLLKTALCKLSAPLNSVCVCSGMRVCVNYQVTNYLYKTQKHVYVHNHTCQPYPPYLYITRQWHLAVRAVDNEEGVAYHIICTDNR